MTKKNEIIVIRDVLESKREILKVYCSKYYTITIVTSAQSNFL